MSDAARNNVSFGPVLADVPRNAPNADGLPCCAYCGSRAERGYPDQSNEDVALPCSDAEGHDYCSRGCAIEFALTLHRRGEFAIAQQIPAGMGRTFAQVQKRPSTLRRELTELYEAAVVLSNVPENVWCFIEATDAGGGVLERAQDEDRPAVDGTKAFVDLRGFRDLSTDLCGLLGGAVDDPNWLRGARKSGAAEGWLEALVAFRTERLPNEVWPYAEDLSRAQIACLHRFYMDQISIEATDRPWPAECG